jgi:lipopolysaccharide export system protein LptA
MKHLRQHCDPAPRISIAIMALVCLAIASLYAGGAQAQSNASSEALVVEASQSLEWDQNKGIYRAVGNAKAQQGSQIIEADELTASYDAQTEGSDITQIIGKSNVRFVDGSQRGQGSYLVYDQTNQSYTLDGPDARVTGPDGKATALTQIFYDKNAAKITLTDDAEVFMTDGRELAADLIHILLDDEQNVSTIEAIGTVRVKQPNGQTATSDKADYNKTENTALFSGNVVIMENDSVLTGDRAEIDFTSGISRMLSSRSGQRIKGRFTTR